MCAGFGILLDVKAFVTNFELLFEEFQVARFTKQLIFGYL